jgi:hypothetical protein
VPEYFVERQKIILQYGAVVEKSLLAAVMIFFISDISWVTYNI